MKKSTAFLLSIILILLLAACGKQEEVSSVDPTMTLPNGFNFDTGSTLPETTAARPNVTKEADPPAESTEAPGTEAESTEEETEVPPGYRMVMELMFVSSNTLNMRSDPSTSSTVIYQFYRGYCVNVISEENGWYRIKDDVQFNPATESPQQVTDYEGYVSKEYLVADYSQIR